MTRYSIHLITAFVLALFVQPALAQDDALPSLAGTIAYIGSDFNVYTLSGADHTRSALTEDAGPVENQLHIYQWPTWATDGRLAYFRMLVNRSGGVDATEVFVTADASKPGEAIYSGEQEVFNYAYWSPQNCDDGENCRDLALLVSRPSAAGLVVELVRDALDAPSSETAGTGAPFYYSWSPDGTRMVWHRNNARIDVFDVASNTVEETVDAQPGIFAAPAWSPVDDRLLFAVQSEGDGTSLVIRANGESETIADALAGPVAFAWSPDGNYVAYTTESGTLTVVDAVTGEPIAESSSSGVLAFFWSPDSHQLAYVSLSTPPGTFSADGKTGVEAAKQTQPETGLLWSVMSVETGSTRLYTTFLPTRDMIYLLTYFDQFAHSHNIWSPDSRYLLYGEITTDNQPFVTLLDVTSDDPVPLTIAEGYIGIWSYQ